MSELCDVHECKNRAQRVIEKGDDSIEGMAYCQKHFRQAVNNILEKHSLGRHNNDV